MTGEAHSSYHPPLPPTTEDQRYSWLRLLRSRGVGIATFYRLMAEYDSAQNVLEALPELAVAAGVKGYEICPPQMLDAEIANAKAAHARLLCFGDPNYPKLLMQLKNAPPLLWARGNLSCLHRASIAMVGARNASSLGVRMAKALSRDLGEAGFLVTSGLARGIDTAAHSAALRTGTIGVLAGGVDIIYPANNMKLAEAILDTGVLISEQPMGMQPQARHFPARNRIIAGMSEATVVVEAAAKSGSLITARDALDLGREVLAVPGHPLDARASGCNILIRDGATLVRSAEDIIETIPQKDQTALPITPPLGRAATLADLPRPPKERRSLQETNALHREVLMRLGPSPTEERQLLKDINRPTREIMETLTDLEIEGEITRIPGGAISRNC